MLLSFGRDIVDVMKNSEVGVARVRLCVVVVVVVVVVIVIVVVVVKVVRVVVVVDAVVVAALVCVALVVVVVAVDVDVLVVLVDGLGVVLVYLTGGLGEKGLNVVDANAGRCWPGTTKTLSGNPDAASTASFARKMSANFRLRSCLIESLVKKYSRSNQYSSLSRLRKNCWHSSRELSSPSMLLCHASSARAPTNASTSSTLR